MRRESGSSKTLRQKKGIDGSAPDPREVGVVDPSDESGPVDPTGAVSSGIQTGPLRPSDKEPGSDEDTA